MPAYKMESLSQKCKKVISNNINLQKTNNLPNEGLAERTILEVVNELKEKNEKEYIIYLNKFKELLTLYDNRWRDMIFYVRMQFANNPTNLEILNKDRAVQEAVLKREIKNKIFLKKNNYNIQKSFFEFLNELNSYLNYKLSRNYKDFDFVNSGSDLINRFNSNNQYVIFTEEIGENFGTNTFVRYHKKNIFENLLKK